MKRAAAEVVVVGNAGIDTNVYLPGPPAAMGEWSRETSFTENLDTVGQAGGYAARAFARLGHHTAFVGYVGDDALGRFLLAELSADGVDCSHVALDPAGTNRSVNLMTPDGQRHSFFDGKSHLSLQPDLEAWSRVFDGARLAHFSIPNWARLLVPIVRHAGCTISVDLQDVHDLDDPYRRDFAAAADVTFFSAAHLDVSMGLRHYGGPGRVAVSGLGARGCAISVDGVERHFDPVDLDRDVVDTNGAGDSLAAGFLSSWLLEGRAIEESVRRGQLAARWCCSLRGTSRGLITRAELEALM